MTANNKVNTTIECPICEAHSVYHLWFIKLKGSRTGKYNPMYFCRKCDSFFQRPDYHEDDNTLKNDLIWLLNHKDINRKRTEFVIRQITQIAPDSKTLLDIGCGIGTSIEISKEFGLIAQGIEPNPYVANYVKETLSLDLIQSYFSSHLLTNKYDIIIVDNVLEHVPLPKSFIQDVFKVLKPGGLLFLAVPNRSGGILRIVKSFIFPTSIFSLFCDNDVHINHFSRKSILHLIKPHDAILKLELSAGEYIIQFNGSNPIHSTTDDR